MTSTTANPSKLVFTIFLFAVIIVFQLFLILFFEGNEIIVESSKKLINSTAFVMR